VASFLRKNGERVVMDEENRKKRSRQILGNVRIKGDKKTELIYRQKSGEGKRS